MNMLLIDMGADHCLIFISERFLRIKVSDVVYGKITQHVDGAELSSFFSNIPSGFAKIVKLFGIDMSCYNFMFMFYFFTAVFFYLLLLLCPAIISKHDDYYEP